MDYELDKRLDAFVRGEFCEKALIRELCAACAATPDLTWDVLAITDQYHRLGRISVDLSRTIRDAVERPAVARELAGFVDATPKAPMAAVGPAAQVPQVVALDVLPAAQVPQVVALDVLPALHGELHATRQKLLRYRTRLTRLTAFGHRHRNALAEVRRELESSRVHTALDLARSGRGAVSVVDNDRDGHRPASRWVPQSQFAAAIAMILTVTASSALREAPLARIGPITATPGKAATALLAAPTLPELQKLSLDSERYVLRPGVRQALIRVQRTGGSTGKVSFTWWTSPSGAKSGADYRGRKRALERFPEGVDAVTLSVPIIANPRRAHTELFYVAIGRPSGGAVIGAIRTSVVIIMPKG